MAEAEIFRAIRLQREAVNRSEKDILRQMARQWLPIHHYLEEQFGALMKLIKAKQNAGEDVPIEYIYSQQRYQDMLRQSAEAIRQYNRAVRKIITGAEADAVEIGNANAKQLVNIAEPDDPMWTRINKRETRIISGMLSEQSPLSRLLDKSFSQTRTEIDKALLIGLGTGQGSSWIAEQLSKAGQVPLERALLIARTEVNRAYRQANLETMRSSRAVRGYRRMCYPPTACFACLMMDGEYYDKAEDFSDHPNGKCSAVPVTKHFDPANDKNWERGQDWFARQDEATQRKLMGPGRFDLWKQSGVDPRDMVWIKPNKVWGGSPAVRTLEELRNKPITNVSYRLGVPIQPTEMTIDMALSREHRAQVMVEKYHINLTAGGKKVTIKIDSSLRGKAGKVSKDDPTTIVLGDSAFISEEELACTIAHELVHCREYVNTGESDETRSYESEGKLREFIRGQR